MGLFAALFGSAGCAETPATFAVEGEVVWMTPTSGSKQVQGQAPATGVEVALRPTRVAQGDDTLPEARWKQQFATRYRAKDDVWVFSTVRPPVPELVPAGTLVVATVDDKGFLQGVTAAP